MKKCYWFLIAGIQLWTAFALSMETVSFEEIPGLVRNKNPEVAVMKNRAEAKKSREGHLVRSFLPEISAEVSQESMKLGQGEQLNQSAWKVEAGINIFRGGSDKLENETRSLEALGSGLALQNVERSQLQTAYEHYWTLVFKQDVLNSLKSHVDLSKKNLSDANRRISSGVATSTDRLEFEMKISLIKQEIAVAERDIRALSAKLGLLLGYDGAVMPKATVLNHSHDWETTLQPIEPEKALEMKVAQNEKATLQAKAQQHAGNYFPAIDLYAGYVEPNQRHEREFSDPADRKESYVGVMASWSLGKAIEGSVERGALQKELSAKSLEMQSLTNQLKLHQANKVDELRVLHSFVHDAEENIKVSLRYLEATLKEYGRGVKNSPDVLEATEKYISAKVRLAEIAKDFNIQYSAELARRTF